PFGVYLQLGEAEGDEKPKRASLPKNLAPAEVDLKKALALLALPREIGRHPDDGKPITAGIGRYGPYVKHGSTYRSLSEGDDVLTIGLNRAVALVPEAPQHGSAGGGQPGTDPGGAKAGGQGQGRDCDGQKSHGQKGDRQKSRPQEDRRKKACGQEEIHQADRCRQNSG